MVDAIRSILLLGRCKRKDLLLCIPMGKYSRTLKRKKKTLAAGSWWMEVAYDQFYWHSMAYFQQTLQ